MAKKDIGPPRWKTRTFAGITLEPVENAKGERLWCGVIAGEPWAFYERSHKRWSGYTKDHLTGTPILLSLGRAVAWCIDNIPEWQAKLKIRRVKGTRMVDPVDNATKAS